MAAFLFTALRVLRRYALENSLYGAMLCDEFVRSSVLFLLSSLSSTGAHSTRLYVLAEKSSGCAGERERGGGPYFHQAPGNSVSMYLMLDVSS